MTQPRDAERRIPLDARRRIVLALLFSLGALALLARAAQIQLWMDDDLGSVADNQVQTTIDLPAPRGNIYDRNGNPFTVNVPRYSFFAYPGAGASVSELAHTFSAICRESSTSLQRRWSKREGRYTWLARHCAPDIADDILNNAPAGVYATPEPARAYPTIGEAWSPVGFVNIDNKGVSGLENLYDNVLTGKPGEGACWRDAKGQLYAADPVALRYPISGSDVVTTLDAEWQSILSEELQLGVERHNAQWGLGLLVDPQTGAVLAMADCSRIGLKEPTTRNRIVSEIFEPGSTFKLVTWAAAFEEGVLMEDDLFWAGHGKERFSNRTIRDDHPHDTITAAQAFIVSSNIVAGRIGIRLGGERLQSWARRFGFGRESGIDFPAETGGIVAEQRWSDVNIATLSFGHGVACTPLQLAMAYAAVANGGLLLKPYIAQCSTSPDGTVHRIGSPTIVSRLLDPVVAHKMRVLMARVVTEGTAKPIAHASLPIAGKTGTAETIDLETGRVNKDRFAALFVGFHPVETPKVLGVIMLMEPEPVHYGGWTSAPVFKRIVERGQRLIESPDEEKWRYGTKGEQALLAGFGPSDLGSDRSGQLSEPVLIAAFDDEALWNRCERQYWVPNNGASQSTDTVTVPDVIGLSLREALNEFYRRGLNCLPQGSGFVVQQWPKPHVRVTKAEPCRLTLR